MVRTASNLGRSAHIVLTDQRCHNRRDALVRAGKDRMLVLDALKQTRMAATKADMNTLFVLLFCLNS